MSTKLHFFVTGATGFVGRHFLELALRSGHKVTALVRTMKPSLESDFIKAYPDTVEFVRGDVLNIETYRESLKHCDVLMHIASAFAESDVDDSYFEKINVNGSKLLATAAAEAGIKRFVYCSTAGIHGQRVPGVVNEEHSLNPYNAYETSKVGAERVIREISEETNMQFTIIRPSSIYGPHDNRLEKLYRSAEKGRFPLFGAGDGRRHMVYVADLAEALLAASIHEAADGEAIIIAGPGAKPLHEMLDILAKCLGKKSYGPKLPLTPMLIVAGLVEDICRVLSINPPIYRRRMDFYLNDIEFDCSKAERVLGWYPHTDLEAGFRKTLEARKSSHESADGAVA